MNQLGNVKEQSLERTTPTRCSATRLKGGCELPALVSLDVSRSLHQSVDLELNTEGCLFCKHSISGAWGPRSRDLWLLPAQLILERTAPVRPRRFFVQLSPFFRDYFSFTGGISLPILSHMSQKTKEPLGRNAKKKHTEIQQC